VRIRLLLWVLRRRRIASTCLTLLLLLAANLALAANGRYWDAQSDGLWGLRRIAQCESLGSVPDVLFIGSSRTLYGVRPAQVDTLVRRQNGQPIVSCNVGLLGSTIEQDYYTLKRVIEDGYAPKLVVENLWEWNLNVGAGVPADASADHLQQVLTLARLSDLPNLRRHFADGPDGTAQLTDFTAAKLVPLYRDREGLLAALCGDARIGPCADASSTLAVLDPNTVAIYQRSTPNGWVSQGDPPLSTLTPAQLHDKQTRADDYYHRYFQHLTIGGHQPAYLARLIALARAHGVAVKLIVSPLHPSLYTYMEHPSDWQIFADYWRQFASAQGVTLYDESHAPGYTDADFVDPQHLSSTGAAKFSSWLASNVVGPALAGGRPCLTRQPPYGTLPTSTIQIQQECRDMLAAGFVYWRGGSRKGSDVAVSPSRTVPISSLLALLPIRRG
jgi:hypothetical protein